MYVYVTREWCNRKVKVSCENVRCNYHKYEKCTYIKCKCEVQFFLLKCQVHVCGRNVMCNFQVQIFEVRCKFWEQVSGTDVGCQCVMDMPG